MKYASEGYTPFNNLKTHLGDYAYYVVYAPNAFNYYNRSFIEEAGMNHSFLRQQLVSVLKNLAGPCKYPEKGKKILCTDVLNPHAIPNLSLYFDCEEHRWRFSSESDNCLRNSGNYILLQNDIFLFAIRLDKEKDQVELFIYRK